MIKLSEMAKKTIVAILAIIALVLFEFAAIFGWDLAWWNTVVPGFAAALAWILGVEWVAPNWVKRLQNTGSGTDAG